MCQMLSLAAAMLADTRGRPRPAGPLRMAEGEADAMHQVLHGAEVALPVVAIFHALKGGRDESTQAISRDGIDPVARAVLDAGGHVALAQFELAQFEQGRPQRLCRSEWRFCARCLWCLRSSISARGLGRGRP